MIHVTKYT